MYIYACKSLVIINSRPIKGEFIRPNDIKCVLNEGMPMYKSPFEKGRLIISFNVRFPESGQIDLRRIGELEKILPAKARVDIPENSEELTLVDLDPAFERSKRQDAYMDDDMPRGQQRVQCANQ